MRPAWWPIAALLLSLLGGRAEAHAVLLAAEPADGAVLASAPSRIQLRFNEVVAPISVKLLDARGQAVETPAPLVQDEALTLELPPSLPDGGYALSYRVTSQDSHVVTGTLLFSVGQAAAGPRPAASADRWGPVYGLVRALASMLALLGGGGAIVLATVFAPADVPRGLRGRLALLAGLGTLAALLTLGLKGSALADSDAAALLTLAPWRTAAATTLGPAVLVEAVGLLGVALLVRTGGGALAGLCGALTLASFALTGHAATARPQALTAPALWLHTLAIGFWVGAFLPLGAALRGRIGPATRTVERFSLLAVPVVALLVAAGLLLAWVQVRHVEALWSTAYGRLLLLKLALVAGLIALAALNRLRLTPALERSGDTLPLRRAIAAEAALAVLIVGVTTAMGQTEPPRALALARPTAVAAPIATDMAGPNHFMAEAQSGAYAAMTMLGEASVGSTWVQTELRRGDDPIRPEAVTVELSLLSAGIEPIKVPLKPGAGYAFRADAVRLPTLGTWRLAVEAVVDGGFDKVTFVYEVPVAADSR